jgi:DNA (cytosine-5)-methyltransferase 1
MPDAPNGGSNTKRKPAGLGNQVIELALEQVRADQDCLLPTPGAQDRMRGPRSRESLEAKGIDDRGKRLDRQKNLNDIANLLPTPTTRDHKGQNQRNDDSCLHGALESTVMKRVSSDDDNVTLFPTPQARDAKGAPKDGFNNGNLAREIIDCDQEWGKYGEAVARWERLTRPAPAPTEPGVSGLKRPRIRPEFSEWMMGWPLGWVTNPEIGITRRSQLTIIGNGVCTHQAAAAIAELVNRTRECWSA